MPTSKLFPQNAFLKVSYGKQSGRLFPGLAIFKQPKTPIDMQTFLIIIVALWLIAFVWQIPAVIKTVTALKRVEDITSPEALYLEKQLANQLFIIILIALIAAIFYQPLNN
jgi:hypothetical protein